MLHAVHSAGTPLILCSCSAEPPAKGRLSHRPARTGATARLIYALSPLAQGERRIRGTGIYALPSLINHECLPNVARFDRFDRPPADDPAPGANAAVEFRALHDIPQGGCCAA